MRYVIHACPERMWFVNGYMIPEMVRQGINESDIKVWNDETHKGNLMACMECFKWCGDNQAGDGSWHLQDDACLATNFAEMTRKHNDGVVTGFVRKEWQTLKPTPGKVLTVYMWNSFLCIRIPDELAGECAEWFYTDAAYRETFREWVEHNKADDSFFYSFIVERYTEDYVYNIYPALVDHVDFLLGGSITNKERESESRGSFWEDVQAYERMLKVINKIKSS